MATPNLEKLVEFIEKFETSSLGRSLSIIVSLAEANLRIPADRGEVAPVDDRLLSPKEAARYLGISWPTLRDSWVDQYEIKKLGDGRGQRFRVSELQRVIKLRESEQN